MDVSFKSVVAHHTTNTSSANSSFFSNSHPLIFSICNSLALEPEVDFVSTKYLLLQSPFQKYPIEDCPQELN